MGASSSVFVGREAESNLVSSALEASLASSPQIVSIEGEAGIGKTAFLRRALPTRDDVVVLEASGDESEIALEYGVVSQLASRAAHVASVGPLKERIEDPSAASVFSVGAELLATLGALQDRAPVVIAVDDAHVMDLSSASALLFALRRLYADRVFVLLASRGDELDRLGLSWLRFLADPERVRRLRLAGLSARDVGLLADSLGFGPLTLAAAERLREHTGGHPLYVRALLSELPAASLSVDEGPLPAPHSFSATVLARMADVGSATQDLVAAAAVVGMRCPLELAGSIAGVNDPLAALDDALAADLLKLLSARLPEEVSFPHPLVRAAVYDDLSPSRRRRLHLACAALTSGSASLPHRVAASPGADDALAGELTGDGEEQVAGGALAAGAEQLLWAWRVAASPELGESALLRAVECLVLAGEVPRALALYDAVLECAEGPRRSFVKGLLTMSAGRLTDAEAELAQVVERPDFADHPELFGPVISARAIMCALLGKGEEAIALAHRALDSEDPPPTVKVIARQALLLGLADVGQTPEGIAVLDSLSSRRLRPEPFEAELLASRGTLKTWWGDLTGAFEDLSAVIRWSRDGAPLRSLPNAYSALAQVDYLLGHWDDGLSHAEIAVSLAEDTDRAWDLPFVHSVASHIYADRGSWRFAADHAEAAAHAAKLVPVPAGRYYASVAVGHLAWVRQDWDAVVDSLAPLDELRRRMGMPGLGQRVPWLLEAEALISTGCLDQAAQRLKRVDRALGDGPQDATRVDLYRLHGVLEHARGHPAKARAAFLEGREAAKVAGSPFAQATLELSYGRVLHRTGSRRAAIAALRVARGLFEQLGARPFLERCDVELAACGVRSGSDGADDDYGLTAREQVVARLVASGKSNREVAAELYLSTKAIEYHLANIFTKIGIHSRHELAPRIGNSSSDTKVGATAAHTT